MRNDNFLKLICINKSTFKLIQYNFSRVKNLLTFNLLFSGPSKLVDILFVKTHMARIYYYFFSIIIIIQKL